MANNGLNCPLFVLDASFIKEFLNGDVKNNILFKEIVKRKAGGLPYVVVTNQATLLRGITMAGDMVPLKSLKNLIELVKVYPSNADYKDGKKVHDEFMKLTKLLSEGGL